ncbi:MAG: branched-chain amino acid ABC transporter permease [Anaerolineae bacterium]|nr:branched-chain amino acid ABC transporter permease [Anaerolineales bacterium]MCQ3973849.1 branched-chain amino acid ABC transporter permease [Anaerolineae bacterium]
MQVVNTIVQGILLGSLYALFGTGLSLIFGVMRLVNLAHGDFIVLAAYLGLLAVALGLHPLLSLVIVIPVLFILGVLLQRGILNRVLNEGLMPPLVITFGLSVLVQNGLQLGFSADSKDLDAGALETASLHLGEVTIGAFPFITFMTAIVILAALQLFLNRTKLGQAFRATSDDPATAELMGINSRQIYGWAMGLSLAIVAVAGVLLGIRTNFTPTIGPARLIFAFETVIIGGLGSIWGTLAGGIILGLAQNIGAAIDPTWFQLAGHIVTLVVLAVKPSGLFARTRDV